jgi:hypothetical protein
MFMPLTEGVQDRDASGRRIDAARDPPDVEAQLRGGPGRLGGADVLALSIWYGAYFLHRAGDANPVHSTPRRVGNDSARLPHPAAGIKPAFLKPPPTQGSQSGEACPAAPIFSEGSW